MVPGLTLAGQAHSGAASADATVQQLRDRIRGMQDGVPRVAIATHPALADLVQLRTGGSYEVDSAGLAMALIAAASQAGAWSAVVGAEDFGAEAAAEMGVDLARTVLVPDPGELWLEVTSALVDVVTMVVLRPPAGVTERVAGRVAARLRKRSSALVSWGHWPGAEASLSLRSSTWSGAERGHGRLRSRRVEVDVRRGSAPPRRAELWLPGQDLTIGRAGEPVHTARDEALA
ncbi:hypothetical protein ACVW00_000362 [Marmoricola sp. URHA0025 HA25]